MDEDFVTVTSMEQLLKIISEQAKAIKNTSDNQNKLADVHMKLAETQTQLARTQENLFGNLSNNLSNVYEKLLTRAFDSFDKYMSSSPQTSVPQTQISILETFLDTSKKLYSADGVPISSENNWLAPDNPHHSACHICLYYGHNAEQCL